jgi:DNA-binding transcriptional ArsR family regulator
MLYFYNMSRSAREERIFKALADGRRRRILDLLRSEPLTTGDLCAHFPDLNRCTVMQHLGVLERAGLVIVRREGRLRWNYIDPLPIKEIHDRWIGPYAAGAVELLARMKREMEE